MKRILILLLYVISQKSFSKGVNDPSFTITGLTKKPIIFSKTQIMKTSKFLKKITIKNDPSYDKDMAYWAIPFRSLISKYKIKPDATIQFTCIDGYSSNLDTESLLNTTPLNEPWLAVQPVDFDEWPLSRNSKVVGPFYLVWPSPKDAKIIESQWPFNLKSINIINKSIEEQFPKIVPKGSIELTEVVKVGFLNFKQTCFSCHKINGQGSGVMGPDLNNPSFLKVLGPEMLKKIVRNPKSITPTGKMDSFSEDRLSTAELDSIITYLKYMDEHR